MIDLSDNQHTWDNQNLEFRAFLQGYDRAVEHTLEIGRSLNLEKETQKNFNEILELLMNHVKAKRIVYICKPMEENNDGN